MPSGIRTQNPSKWEATNPNFTLCRHWDWLFWSLLLIMVNTFTEVTAFWQLCYCRPNLTKFVSTMSLLQTALLSQGSTYLLCIKYKKCFRQWMQHIFIRNKPCLWWTYRVDWKTYSFVHCTKLNKYLFWAASNSVMYVWNYIMICPVLINFKHVNQQTSMMSPLQLCAKKKS